MEREPVSIHASGGHLLILLPPIPSIGGSRDGAGAGDHDAPYTFGRRPRASAPFPFSLRQYTRLLVLRGRIQANLAGADDGAAT